MSDRYTSPEAADDEPNDALGDIAAGTLAAWLRQYGNRAVDSIDHANMFWTDGEPQLYVTYRDITESPICDTCDHDVSCHTETPRDCNYRTEDPSWHCECYRFVPMIFNHAHDLVIVGAELADLWKALMSV